jgi:hypothetical protein
MRLNAIKPGDIVAVDDGIPYLAVVLERDRGQLRVTNLGRSLAPRTVKAAWVSTTGATSAAPGSAPASPPLERRAPPPGRGPRAARPS